MTTNKVLFSGLLAVVALACLVLAIRFIGGDEDTWLCQDGQWVRHGNPSAPIPAEPCVAKDGRAGTGADPRLSGWQKPEISDFVRTGKLVRNESGLKPNVWYFWYEQPASPAQRIELIFLEGVSACEFGGGEMSCLGIAVQPDAPAKIQGYRVADAAVVWKLESPPGAGQRFAYFSSLSSGLPFKDIQRVIGAPDRDEPGEAGHVAFWALPDGSEMQAAFDGQDFLVGLTRVQLGGQKQILLQ